MRVGAKLHNYMMNMSGLNFISTLNDDYSGSEVELLVDEPEGSRGYLPIYRQRSQPSSQYPQSFRDNMSDKMRE